MNPSLGPSPTRSPLYFIVRMINTNHHRGSRTNEKTMDVLREFPRPATFPGFGILTNLCQKSGFQFSPRKLDVGIIRKSSFGAVKSRNPFAGIRAAATVEAPDVKVDSNVETTVDVLSCPICYKPLIRKGPSGLNMSFVSRSGFQCGNCKKAYSTRDVYIDLTVTAGSSEYDEYRPLTTELFRSPLVSFVYERGWRQNFASGGFPGPDEEFRMAQKILEPAAGGLLVDASCGSGLFSRRFANCGLYSGVVALDFSENMLRQCYEFIKQDKALSTANLALVRADISRLPFTAGSVDAVHAGAALHCWPSPSSADIEDQSIKLHHHLHKIIINILLHQQDYKGELSTIIMKMLKTIYTLYY